MKKTSLITDFICYFIVFIIVFSVGVYIIGNKIVTNRKLLISNNELNVKASTYTKDFALKQKELNKLTLKRDQLLVSLEDITALTESKLKNSSDLDSDIDNLKVEIDSLTDVVASYSKELSTLSATIKELNSSYVEKNNVYLKILQDKINNN